MFHVFTKKAFTAFLLATSAATVSAQVYQSPNAYEFTYGNPNVKFPQSTSNHAMPAGAAYFPSLGLGSTDLYVAGWNDPDPGRLSEVTVMLTPPGNPTAILWQGSIYYNDIQDLEVGSLRDPSANETVILAAYYKPGVGHFLDVHKLGPGGVTGLISSTPLSNSPTYGPIQMDFHSLWSGAVAWINPAVNRIQTMVYDNNTWSGISTINGTNNKTDLDISLEQVDVTSGSSYKELHLAYAGINGFITESSLNFNTLATVPGIHTPTVNDNMYIGGTQITRLTLDCPGFSLNGSRWAYTYSDIMNVIVRFRDPAVAGGSPQMAVVTAGTLGNVPIAGSYKMFSPSLNYEFNSYTFGVPDDIMVTWYATDGAGFNKYIGLKMDPTGTFVTSLGDYLDLPNAQTPTYTMPFSSGIALNKTDAKTPSPFSYATYFDVDPVTGLYQLHHAFHNWGDPAFRGQEPDNGEAIANTRISSYPNPFREQLNVSIELPQNSIVEFLLTDISGRTAAQANYALTRGTHQVSINKLGQLAPGTYLLTTLIDHKKAGVQKITKQ